MVAILVDRPRHLWSAFRAGHSGSRRCSSLTYSRYARSSRLAIRAPRSKSTPQLTRDCPLAVGGRRREQSPTPDSCVPCHEGRDPVDGPCDPELRDREVPLRIGFEPARVALTFRRLHPDAAADVQAGPQFARHRLAAKTGAGTAAGKLVLDDPGVFGAVEEPASDDVV